MTVIKSKNYVSPPPGMDFKEMFLYMTVAGAGKDHTRSDESWDAETLCEAINMLPGAEGRNAVKARAVRYWFQDNDKGIRSSSINHLAVIFGCGDPEKVADMRVALRKSQALLSSRRHKEKVRVEREYSENKKLRFAHFSSDLFTAHSILVIPVCIWLAGSLLLIMSYFLGTHSVSYTIAGGIPKEVGLFWSTSWILGELIFLPAAVMIAVVLVSEWVNNMSPAFHQNNKLDSQQHWRKTAGSYTTIFYIIVAACFFVVFLFQWSGAYMHTFVSGENQNGMTDWLLVVLEPGQERSKTYATFVSIYGFLYSGLIYWVLFTGVLLSYIVTSDFLEKCRTVKERLPQGMLRQTSNRLFFAAYLFTTLGLSVALTLRINAAYLVSDGPSFSQWLLSDFLTLLGRNDFPWNWLDGSPLPYLTSFMLMVIMSFVGIACMLNIQKGVKTEVAEDDADLPMTLWYVSLSVQVICHLLAGLFYGFSLLLLAGIIAVVFISLIIYLKTTPNEE